MKWFKHDSDAHTDAKLRKLRIRYGAEGYGIYWYCLELICGNIDAHNLTFELEHDAEIIAHDFGIHADNVQEMMKFMCELGLFEVTNGGVISCLKMAKRLDQSMASKPAFRKAIADLSSPESWKGHDPVMEGSCKKRREKKRKETTRGRFSPPSAEEVQSYLDEKNITGFTGEEFVDYYASVNWMRGKNKIKSWQHCIGTWKRNRTEENESSFGRNAI